MKVTQRDLDQLHPRICIETSR